eukprot:gene11675-biopygen3371
MPRARRAVPRAGRGAGAADQGEGKSEEGGRPGEGPRAPDEGKSAQEPDRRARGAAQGEQDTDSGVARAWRGHGAGVARVEKSGLLSRRLPPSGERHFIWNHVQHPTRARRGNGAGVARAVSQLLAWGAARAWRGHVLFPPERGTALPASGPRPFP